MKRKKHEEVQNSGQQLERDIEELCGMDKKTKEEEDNCSGSGSSQDSSKE